MASAYPIVGDPRPVRLFVYKTLGVVSGQLAAVKPVCYAVALAVGGFDRVEVDAYLPVD
jgi:hypothetical protein